MELPAKYRKNIKRKVLIIAVLALLTAAAACLCLFVGSSHMTARESLAAFAKKGTPAHNRIIWNIRMPRVIAALVAGAGLSLSGLIMQTSLNNPMASPSTLGVSNAAVFGANVSIVVFAGGFWSAGANPANYTAGINPYAAGTSAFLFAALSALLILGLCRLRAFSPGVVVLAGIAAGSVWTAATTLLQFYATDVGLSAAVIWSFGDLGRAGYLADWIMSAALAAGLLFFGVTTWKYNALLSGDTFARSMGVHVSRLRFVSLLLSSLMTAACVACLGVIGFVGIICPHIAKKLVGQDHRFSVPASALCGSVLLLTADAVSRTVGGGAAIPVGALTSLLGAPFFIAILFSKKERE